MIFRYGFSFKHRHLKLCVMCGVYHIITNYNRHCVPTKWPGGEVEVTIDFCQDSWYLQHNTRRTRDCIILTSVPWPKMTSEYTGYRNGHTATLNTTHYRQKTRKVCSFLVTLNLTFPRLSGQVPPPGGAGAQQWPHHPRDRHRGRVLRRALA